jgi:hypothetical protein
MFPQFRRNHLLIDQPMEELNVRIPSFLGHHDVTGDVRWFDGWVVLLNVGVGWYIELRPQKELVMGGRRSNLTKAKVSTTVVPLSCRSDASRREIEDVNDGLRFQLPKWYAYI